MLDYLWQERATYYLGGAWIGPHSRIWPHDMPKDTNVLHDYVQFGDFKLPDTCQEPNMQVSLRMKLLSECIQTALHRSSVPVEIKRKFPSKSVKLA